ncbi:hypothetical protein F5J12DRAFT_842481, partial [Pisolithus orientalis]|uniref:uncharacterized protein n=1 Tax=Pisolithus orientalis TaxID=936130 RepID=UPI002225A696
MATSPDATLQIGYGYMVPTYPICSISGRAVCCEKEQKGPAYAPPPWFPYTGLQHGTPAYQPQGSQIATPNGSSTGIYGCTYTGHLDLGKPHDNYMNSPNYRYSKNIYIYPGKPGPPVVIGPPAPTVRRTYLRTCSTSLRPIPRSDYPMAPVQRRLRASRALAMNMPAVVGAWPWIVGGLALVFVLFAVLCCIIRRRRRSATYFVAVSNANAMGSESGGPRNSSYMRPTRNRVPAMVGSPGSTNCISNDPMCQGHSDGPLPKDDAVPSTPPPAYH